MRCPKCSFISFDDLAVCAKCAGDLSVLSKELNGTCVEARPEFFLGTAIQTPSIDDDNFSDSQALPPIDHGGINFDDTSTGGFTPVASSASSSDSSSYDLDDSMGLVTEDDVSIELGDIMPIDLDQLDDTSVFSGVALAATDSFDPASFSLDLDRTETINPADNLNIDLDLTGDFASSDSESPTAGDFSEINFDDSDFDFSSEAPLSAQEGSSAAFPADSDNLAAVGRDTTPDDSVGIALDDDLIAQLSSFGDDPDSSASFSPVLASGSGVDNLGGDHKDSPEFADSLAAELTGSFPADDALSEELLDFSADFAGEDELELDGASGELFTDLDLDDHKDASLLSPEVDSFVESASLDTPIEDLTGEFSPISYGEEPELGDLNLSDIDVTDLIEPSLEEDVLLGDDISSSDDISSEVVLPSGVFEGVSGGEDFVSDLYGPDVSAAVVADGDGEASGSAVSQSVAADSSQLVDIYPDSALGMPVEDLTGEFLPKDFGEDVDLESLPEMSLSLSETRALGDDSSDGELFDEIDISELEAELVGSFGAGSGNDDVFPEIELILDEEDDEEPPSLPV